jgi:hypothetical protein
MNTETHNDFFTDLENVRPFLKMAFEGFAGDGKTYTMAAVAIGLHKLIGSDKPIAVIDTERAMDECEGDTIYLDWDGKDVSKQEAKEYVLNYGASKN